MSPPRLSARSAPAARRPRRVALLAAATLTLGMLATVAHAAEEWGIEGEKTVRFTARVTDLLCAITGNCPADCGAGRHQLGLLLDDGRLLPAVKNYDPFAGATVELLPFCNKRVVADGLLIEKPAMRLFALQYVRLAPDGKWRRADRFGRKWAKKHGRKDASNWFREDPQVRRIIKKDGVFGIPGLKP